MHPTLRTARTSGALVLALLPPAAATMPSLQLRRRLRLTPVNPLTGAPIGPTYEAIVSDHQEAGFDDRGGWVEGLQVQTELPRMVSGHGQRVIRLRVGSHGGDKYKQDIDCTP